MAKRYCGYCGGNRYPVENDDKADLRDTLKTLVFAAQKYRPETPLQYEILDMITGNEETGHYEKKQWFVRFSTLTVSPFK